MYVLMSDSEQMTSASPRRKKNVWLSLSKTQVLMIQIALSLAESTFDRREWHCWRWDLQNRDFLLQTSRILCASPIRAWGKYMLTEVCSITNTCFVADNRRPLTSWILQELYGISMQIWIWNAAERVWTSLDCLTVFPLPPTLSTFPSIKLTEADRWRQQKTARYEL